MLYRFGIPRRFWLISIEDINISPAQSGAPNAFLIEGFSFSNFRSLGRIANSFLPLSFQVKVPLGRIANSFLPLSFWLSPYSYKKYQVTHTFSTSLVAQYQVVYE